MDYTSLIAQGIIDIGAVKSLPDFTFSEDIIARFPIYLIMMVIIIASALLVFHRIAHMKQKMEIRIKYDKIDSLLDPRLTKIILTEGVCILLIVFSSILLIAGFYTENADWGFSAFFIAISTLFMFLLLDY